MYCFKRVGSTEAQNTLALGLGLQRWRVQASRVKRLFSSFFLITGHLRIPISLIYSIVKKRGLFGEEDALRYNEQRVWGEGKYRH